MNEKLDNAKLGSAKNKTEQAGIMGVKIPGNDYWGDYSSKICGGVGGAKNGNSAENASEGSNQK